MAGMLTEIQMISALKSAGVEIIFKPMALIPNAIGHDVVPLEEAYIKKFDTHDYFDFSDKLNQKSIDKNKNHTNERR